jgi:hypothetical protein
MRILCCDIRLVGKPHHDWKEGYELMYAFRNLGHTCDVAGPHGLQYRERDIPYIANRYDLIIVTENYPHPSTWKWWDFGSIKTPKLFWALDTHLVDYRPLIQGGKFDYVAFGIKQSMIDYNLPRSFVLYYGLSTVHQKDTSVLPKEFNTIFIGNLTIGRRRELCERFGIQHLEAYGSDYIKTMKKARICFNSSITNDINAKYFEIMSSGSFILTNFNQELLDFCDGNEDLRSCMYTTDEEIGEKIKYYLEHEEEREAIAKRLFEYVWTHHIWEARCQYILQSVAANHT